MKKLHTTAHVFICALVCLPFLLTSCQSSQTNTGSKDSTTITSNLSGTAGSNTIPTIYLSSLTVSSGVFKDNRNKNFVFEHFFGDTDITLHGWILKSTGAGPGQYNGEPDVKLTPFEQTTLTVGPNSYVGNQVLGKNDEKNMVDFIAGRNATLHFKPTQDTPGGRIYYKIFIQFLPVSIVDTDPTYSTNPSPPHQGFD
jgi:hypothetical protein